MTPTGATATVLFHGDEQPIEGLYFHFGDMPEDDSDDNDRIFFYARGEHDLRDMMTAGALDFVVVSYDLEY